MQLKDKWFLCGLQQLMENNNVCYNMHFSPMSRDRSEKGHCTVSFHVFKKLKQRPYCK